MQYLEYLSFSLFFPTASICFKFYSVLIALCVIAEMTVGKDQEVTVKSKGAGGQGKVAAKVTAPSGKPVASKVWYMILIYFPQKIYMVQFETKCRPFTAAGFFMM